MTPPSDAVWLFGLDIGSTTTCALVSQARVVRNCTTGRMELGPATACFRPDPVFTPFEGEALNEQALHKLVNDWTKQSGVDRAALFAGGVIVTGLAAAAHNAAAVANAVRAQIADALIVTADDPRLESWLAFLGNCVELSRSLGQTPVLNLDIGGGTTNPAWGLAGEVQQVGCYAIGARHVRVVPGSWRIAGLSPLAVRLLEHLRISRQIGEELSHDEVQAIVGFYVQMLEAIVQGDPVWPPMEQVRFEPSGRPSVITFSGGVGELIYRHVQGDPLPPTTAFGDLGIDLAQRICDSSLLSGRLRDHTPATLGRATVCGLALHTAEISGTTLYLPHPELLPLAELPIVGRIVDEDPARLDQLLKLALSAGRGAALQIEGSLQGWQAVKRLGELLARSLEYSAWPTERPLVLLVGQNVGKALGAYATDWGKRPVRLVVIDELPPRQARFVSLGKLKNNVVAVCYYGLCEAEPSAPP